MSTSILHQRINLLDEAQKNIILHQTELLYKQCRALNSDDFEIQNNQSIVVIDNKSRNLSNETTSLVVNEYQNCKKSIAKIKDEQNLTDFEVISTLCDNILKRKLYLEQGTSTKILDFTEVIKHMYVEQYSVIQLIDLMLRNLNLTIFEVIAELLCLPSLCLIYLTLIWIEIKHQSKDDLFYCDWNTIDDPQLRIKDFKELENEIQTVFDLHKKNGLQNISECFLVNQSINHLQPVKELVKNRSQFINETLKNLKELDQIIDRKPKLEIETVLSDSSNSDANSEDNDEICVLMQKFTGKWLQTDLSNEILPSEIFYEKSKFYFAKTILQFEDNNLFDGYAMCKLIEIKEKFCTVLFMSTLNPLRDIKKSDMAMGSAPSVRCPEGTRIIALYKSKLKSVLEKNKNQSFFFFEDSYWLEGTVGAKPLMQNRFEYLVFFDNGIDCYVPPEDIRLSMMQPIDHTTNKFEPRHAHFLVTNPNKKNFIKKYLHVFPDWPLLRLKKSNNTMRILAKRKGKEESAFVLDVDRQMCLLRFPTFKAVVTDKRERECVDIHCTIHDHYDEWIYRGNSDRFPTLQNNVLPVGDISMARRVGRNRSRFEIALSEIDCNFPENLNKLNSLNYSLPTTDLNLMQTARKTIKKQNTEIACSNKINNLDLNVKRKLSNCFKEKFCDALDWSKLLKYHFHNKCSVNCVRNLKINTKLEDYTPCSPFFIPLIYGWMRELRKVRNWNSRSEKIRFIVVYRAPCGIRLSKIEDIAKYLQITETKHLTIDLFTFDSNVRPNLIIKPYKDETILQEDFAKGLEDVKIPVVNAINDEKAPLMNYCAKRFADLPIITESVQPQFCSGCNCIDNCFDSNKCECQKLTITSNDRLSASLRVVNSKTYQFRLLSEKILSGLYECNDMCSCSKKLCYNRVVQQNIRIPLELYMTAETGWGVRTLVDIPAGYFICTYSGRLLTDRMAELQGREVSDMYLAELDLHEVVEAEKQQQGIDLIDDDEGIATGDENDCGNEGLSSNLTLNNEKSKTLTSNSQAETVKQSKKKSFFNFETYFGENALFIIDAQESGNIGRFLNHSCEPNVFVQMVMVDTHDLRLPWVAFFAETFVKAGEELRWNYGYSPNSVPGKILICKCGSQFCQGRLL